MPMDAMVTAVIETSLNQLLARTNRARSGCAS